MDSGLKDDIKRHLDDAVRAIDSNDLAKAMEALYTALDVLDFAFNSPESSVSDD